MTNRLFWDGSKDKIKEKIVYLAKAYSLDETNLVEINRKDAIAEGLQDGDIIGTHKIKLTNNVSRNHFLFISDNKP
jgi:hypothetical protein